MDVGNLATWLAVAIEFFAAGAIVIWPDQRWIAWMIMLAGLAIGIYAAILYLSANYADKFTSLRAAWFLIPCGMALGLALTWLFIQFRPPPESPQPILTQIRWQFV